MENKLWEFKVFVDKVNKYLLHIVKKNQRQNQNELTRDRRQGNGEKKEVINDNADTFGLCIGQVTLTFTEI